MVAQTKQELIYFLKEHSFLRVLEQRVLEGVSGSFTEISCGPGHVVYREGDEADAIYIVASGSVEVVRGETAPKVLAYLTAGECFGEIDLINDTKRSATVRVPEAATILCLARKAFNELQSYFPEVTKELNQIVERRLSGKQALQSPGLSGNLAFFDLPTVVQTVVGSRQTGTLWLRGDSGKLVAKVSFRNGKLAAISFLQLSSEQALFELLSRNLPLNFVFEPTADLDAATPLDRELANKEPLMLLLEGARRADELGKLLKDLNWPEAVFLWAVKQPDWSALTGNVQSIGRKIWLLLDAGLTLEELSGKLPYDRYTVLSVLDELLKLNYIRAKEVRKPQEPMAIRSASEIAPRLLAFNGISANLSKLMDKAVVVQTLDQALADSSEKFPSLKSLKLNPETATLDMRTVSESVSQSETTTEALTHLLSTFFAMIADYCQPRGR